MAWKPKQIINTEAGFLSTSCSAAPSYTEWSKRIMKRIFSVVAILALLSSSMLLAHDPKKHKGRPIAGTVEKLTDKGLEFRTEKGTKTVLFTDKTVFEHGDHKVNRSDVKANEHLIILGTTLATGEIVAKEVLWAPSEPQAKEPTAHKH